MAAHRDHGGPRPHADRRGGGAGRRPPRGPVVGAGCARPRHHPRGASFRHRATNLRHLGAIPRRHQRYRARAGRPVVGVARRPRVDLPAARGRALSRRDRAVRPARGGEPRPGHPAQRGPRAQPQHGRAAADPGHAGRGQGSQGTGRAHRPDQPPAALRAAARGAGPSRLLDRPGEQRGPALGRHRTLRAHRGEPGAGGARREPGLLGRTAPVHPVDLPRFGRGSPRRGDAGGAGGGRAPHVGGPVQAGRGAVDPELACRLSRARGGARALQPAQGAPGGGGGARPGTPRPRGRPRRGSAALVPAARGLGAPRRLARAGSEPGERQAPADGSGLPARDLGRPADQRRRPAARSGAGGRSDPRLPGDRRHRRPHPGRGAGGGAPARPNRSAPDDAARGSRRGG